MAFRQIKAPALANAAVINTKLAPSAVSGQEAALAVNSISADTLLLHVAGTDTLAKITVSHLVGSVDTDDLTEGAANLYFTDLRAQTAVATDISTAVAAEAVLARAAEGVNATAISAEATTARAAEGVNDTAISAEVTRASGVESALDAAYKLADTGLQTQINNILNNTDETALNSLAEIVAAYESADDIFTAGILANGNAISAETTARISDVSTLTTSLGLTQDELDASQVGAGLSAAGAYVVGASTNYLTAATSLSDADAKLDAQSKANADAIAAEITRATGVESTNATNIATNVTNIATNVTAISDEATTARTNETALSDDIQAEITARGLADTAVRSEFAAADTAQTTALQTYADTAEADAIATAAADATTKADAAETDAIASAEAKDVARAVTSDAADTALAGRATTLETEMDTAEGRLDALETSGGSADLDTIDQTVAGGINELHTDTNAVEVRVSTAETDITTNATAIANILTNTDEVALNSLAELVAEFQAADGTITGLVNANATAISTEKTRAEGVESTNASAIATEATRADAAEVVNANAVVTEAGTRAGADTTLQGNIDAEATTRANADTAFQTELDATQTGAGLGIDGTYTATAAANYIAAATSLKDADVKLDTQAKVNADAIAAEITRATGVEGTNAANIATNVTDIATNVSDIAQEVIDRGIADVALQDNIDDVQAELDITQAGAGLSATGAYAQNASANYIAAATSLNDADVKLDAALKVEEVRALTAEGLNTTAISDEVTRASGAESLIDTKVDNEVTRATAADGTHTTNIATNATNIAANLSAITTEATTARAAELTLTTNLDAEIARAGIAEDANTTAITTEATTARAAELALSTRVGANETSIAFIEENTDGAALDSLTEIVAAFQSADGNIVTTVTSNTTAINAEATTARAAELLLTNNLAAEVTRAGIAEDANTTAINAEATTARAAEGALATRMTTEEGNVDALELTMGSATMTTTAQNVTAAINELNAAASSDLGAIQAELDTAEAAIVVNATAISDEETRALGVEGTLSTTIGNNDTQVRSDFAAADLSIQQELDATQTGAGLSAAGAYVAPTTSNFHDTATSLASADMKLDTAIKAEETRALAAELVNTNAVSAEATTARAAEALNATAITTENTRATGVEGTLSTDIAANLTEITATQSGAGLSVAGAYVAPTTSNYHNTATSLASADMKIDAALKAEADRALAAEGVNTTAISDEATRAGIAEDANTTAITTEATTARAAELANANSISTVSANLATEITDRTNADASLQTQVDFITSNVDAASLDSLTEIVSAFQTADGDLLTTVTSNTTAITTEATTARAAELANANLVAAEATTARAAEGVNAAAVTSEETRALAAEGILTTAVDTKVAKSGSTMTGVLNMGGNAISGVATPSAATDAASKGYVDGVISSQDISTYTTDDLAEGSNHYFTDTRAQAAISVVDTEGTGRVSYAAGVVTVDTQKSFLELTDYIGGESDYSASVNYVAVVNAAGTGLELVDPTTVLVAETSRQTLSGDGSTTTFALTMNVQAAEDLMVFVGGVIQDPSTHYTVSTSANTITFTAGAMPTGTQAVVVGHQTGYTLSIGAVTSEKLAADIKPFIQSGNVSATTGGDVIDTFDGTTYRSAKYVIQVSDSVSGEYETREALVIHDGTSAYITEFAMVYTGASLIGDASVAMNGTNVELTYTTSSVTASVKVISTYINV